MERLVRGMEELAVEAAFDATVPTEGQPSGAEVRR
jgi:hypothetical protein